MYHHTNEWYEPDELIQPGNWGRVVRGLGGRHDWFARRRSSSWFSDDWTAVLVGRQDCSIAAAGAGWALDVGL